MTRRSRRQVLAAIGASLATAGCAGGGESTTDRPSTTSSTTESPATRSPTATPSPTETPSPTATASPTQSPTPTPAELPRTGPPTAGIEAFDEALPPFMREWDLPGGSVAVAKAGRLVFARSYGFANTETDRAVRPSMLFRVGSLSKPITAIAVMRLVEQGDLALDDRAFEMLSHLVPEDGPADDRVEEITVRQLLQHTAGWKGRRQGFLPMFMPRKIAEAQGEDPPASAEATIRYVLGKELAADPGTTFQYSNFGYCVLGRVVEEVTGESYESHVTSNVLDPVGATDMRIGATRQSRLLDDEVRYYGHREVESPFPDGGEVPRPYAAAHLRANDADGGWIGSAVDLLRVVMGIDGRDATADVLDASTVETMTARPDLAQWANASTYYAKGWVVQPLDGAARLWHDGSLPGSYGFLIHNGNSEVTAAVLFNARAPDPQFRRFNAEAQRTFLRAVGSVSDWPDRDLFDRFE